MRTGKLTHYDAASLGIGESSIYSFCKDSQGNLWIGSGQGVYVRRFGKARFEQIDFLSTFWAFDITEDSRGNLWFASLGGGLCRYEPASGERRFFAHEEGNPASLSSNAVSNVCEDRHGTLWFSTDRGGLCRYDYDTDAFRSYSLGEGMPDNVTYRVLEDSEGMLWLGTNYGLVRFNPETEKIRTYTRHNGLLGNQFNYHAALRGRDGKFWFGGFDGIVGFDPSQHHFSPKPEPALYITGLSINNEEQSVGGEGSPLDRSPLFTDRITLAHNQSNISLRFAGTSFSQTGSIDYYYALEPVDTEWIAARPVTSDLLRPASAGQLHVPHPGRQPQRRLAKRGTVAEDRHPPSVVGHGAGQDRLPAHRRRRRRHRIPLLPATQTQADTRTAAAVRGREGEGAVRSQNRLLHRNRPRGPDAPDAHQGAAGGHHGDERRPEAGEEPACHPQKHTTPAGADPPAARLPQRRFEQDAARLRAFRHSDATAVHRRAFRADHRETGASPDAPPRRRLVPSRSRPRGADQDREQPAEQRAEVRRTRNRGGARTQRRNLLGPRDERRREDTHTPERKDFRTLFPHRPHGAGSRSRHRTADGPLLGPAAQGASVPRHGGSGQFVRADPPARARAIHQSSGAGGNARGTPRRRDRNAAGRPAGADRDRLVGTGLFGTARRGQRRHTAVSRRPPGAGNAWC